MSNQLESKAKDTEARFQNRLSQREIHVFCSELEQATEHEAQAKIRKTFFHYFANTLPKGSPPTKCT